MQHAKLGASNAHRWLVCTASPAFEEHFPNTETEYSKEGTLAHEEASRILTSKKKIKPKYAIQSFVDYVKKESVFAHMEVEKRVDYSEYVPEGFGTADVVLFKEGLLTVIDLKYGQGVMVSAIDNPQLKLYALGALLAYDILFEIETIKMVIHQPRLDNVSEFEMTKDELLTWAESIRDIAQQAYGSEGTFVAGEHCKFCRGKYVCKARKEANDIEMVQDFSVAPEALSDEDITKIVLKADEIIAWLNDIKRYALEEALKGKQFTGLKVVNGRSTRKIVDEQGLADAILQDKTYTDDQIYTTKLKGITELEKLIGKKRFAEEFSQFIDKPEGKPTLVPDTDKRSELNSVQKDFEGGNSYE